MSNYSKRRREGTKPKIKNLGHHEQFLRRITKSLYYGKLPDLPCLSFPVTELSADLFSEVHRGKSLKRLYLDDAAEITRNACVSPCSLVLALLYLERLRTCNPEYLSKIAPSELFLVSLMVSNKFLQDDGEEDEVFADEWAVSGGIDVDTLKQLEREFLQAIDWRIYISDSNFEEGLSNLEHRVALKQVQRHGFCTYSDLLILSRHINVTSLLKTFSSASLAITLSYLTSLITVITSSILISNLCALNIRNDSISSAVNLTMTNDINLLYNVSESVEESLDLDMKIKCCPQWHQHIETPKKIETTVANLELFWDLKDYETWWPKVSMTNWLYQNALISPLLDWYSDFIKVNLLNYTSELWKRENGHCRAQFGHFNKLCVNNWMNINQLGPLVVSVSDR